MSTPTPRTDAAWRSCMFEEEAWEFTRQLERELAAEKEQVTILRSDLKRLEGFAKTYRLRADEAEDKLAAERALADRLAGCMAHLADYDWFIHGTHSHSVVCSLGPDRVREALAAWKEARHEA